MSSKNELKRDLETRTGTACGYVETIIKHCKYGAAGFVADIYADVEKMVCEAYSVSNSNLIPRGGPFEKPILSVKVAWLPCMRWSDKEGRFIIPLLRDYPSLDEMKQAIDDISVPFTKVQLMSWDLVRACEADTVLDTLRYVNEKEYHTSPRYLAQRFLEFLKKN